MLWESSSSDKVAAMESNVFWKSGCYKKVALHEKWVFQNFGTSKNADAAQMYLLRSEELFSRYLCSKQIVHKKVAVPRSNCPKELPVLTKILFLKIRYSEKNDCCKEMTLSKTENFKKAAALKKYILRKSKCCIEVVKEVWSSFSENKTLLKKSLNIPEIAIWKKHPQKK